MTWSVRAALQGRRILLTGVTGFLGKVWLVHLLEALPGIGRIHLLVRPGPGGARARFEDLLATSPAFLPLHERHGEHLGKFLGARLDVVAGDVCSPDLGLDPATLAALEGRLDLVVHLAGVTDLEPSVQAALDTNVEGARQALAVARRTGARLVHVSTAYVAGRRRGRVEERLETTTPSGEPLDMHAETDALRRALARAREEVLEPDVDRALRQSVRDAMRRHGARDVEQPEWLARERERWVDERAGGTARARARARGWPNVYTMSKALAEGWLARERGHVPLVVVRPSIVESAVHLPFPGWKEGLETSGPLTWAMARGPLRSVPARPDVALDVIPVDAVARGVTLAAAALLTDRAPDVVHLASADTHPLPVRRAVDLTALADRGARDESTWAGLLLPQAEVTGDAVYRATSAPLLRRVARGVRGLLDAAAAALPEDDGLLGRAGDRARALSRDAARVEKRLGDLEETVDRFRHFLEHDATFSTTAAGQLHASLDPAEHAAFGFDPTAIDWRTYWLDVHVPGLRRWVWPRLEGKPVERPTRRPVRLEPPPEHGAPRRPPSSRRTAVLADVEAS